MRGANEFILNQQTMIEAVQEYLDKRMGLFAPSVRLVESLGILFKVMTCEKSMVPAVKNYLPKCEVLPPPAYEKASVWDGKK